ncbi:transcription factor bHLH117 [Musa acuminata AAA Group]|uniref:transcription factor bHLH117 n=1 Tax=Musa acuminata AAA Group TaxID=214697 RepID=UPI0031D28A0C
MEGKNAKALLFSPSLTLSSVVLGSSEERRGTASKIFPLTSSIAAGWHPFCSSHDDVGHSHILLSPAAGSNHLTCVPERCPKLTTTKIEPLESEAPDSILVDGGSPGFHRLPMLRSLEPLPLAIKMPSVPLGIPSGDLISVIEPSHKRFRGSSASFSWSPPPCAPPPTAPTTPRHRRPLPSSELSRQRRKKISDRTRIIESLMPWERRMDTGSMLEEASKYIRFLQTQVAALRSMPTAAEFSAAPVSSGRGGGLGGLERLNRQQMLQVVVNSRRVQEKLYERGLCVFSVEQVASLQKEVERRPPFVSAVNASAVNASD